MRARELDRAEFQSDIEPRDRVDPHLYPGRLAVRKPSFCAQLRKPFIKGRRLNDQGFAVSRVVFASTCLGGQR